MEASAYPAPPPTERIGWRRSPRVAGLQLATGGGGGERKMRGTPCLLAAAVPAQLTPQALDVCDGRREERKRGEFQSIGTHAGWHVRGSILAGRALAEDDWKPRPMTRVQFRRQI